jgi:hypothetical protein
MLLAQYAVMYNDICMPNYLGNQQKYLKAPTLPHAPGIKLVR